MYQALIVIHVIVAASLIGLVLIQHGKGADAGAAFGSGSSSTVFGARGSASFLTRLTAFLAAGFFLTSLALGYMTLQLSKPEDSGIAPVIKDKAASPAPAQDTDIPEIPEDIPTPMSSPESDIPVVPEGKTAPAETPAADKAVKNIPE